MQNIEKTKTIRKTIQTIEVEIEYIQKVILLYSRAV